MFLTKFDPVAQVPRFRDQVSELTRRERLDPSNLSPPSFERKNNFVHFSTTVANAKHFCVEQNRPHRNRYCGNLRLSKKLKLNKNWNFQIDYLYGRLHRSHGYIECNP